MIISFIIAWLYSIIHKNKHKIKTKKGKPRDCHKLF